ncbi:MAG: hypothetical protein ACOY8P_08080 [Thermodesulfobacteriota bacterium]
MRTVCCVCQRVKGEHGWVRVAGLIVSRLSHGYCPECYEEALAALEAHAPLPRPRGRLRCLRVAQK